jgi:hypothetical protein
MAKAKDLAALAGLAGLAYAMRNKDKGMTPEENDTLANANRVSKMSDDSDTLARVNRNMSPGQSAVDDTNAGVLNAITKPKAVEDTSNSSNEGRNSKPLSSKTVSKPASTTQTPTVLDRQDLESGMSRGTRPMDPRNIEAGMSRGTRPVDPRDLEAGMSRGARYKQPTLMKKGGVAKKMASGGMTASSRADGCCTKGKTRGKMV